MTYTIRANGPGDVALAAEHMLGFAPTDSLVVLAIGGGSRPSMRVDHPRSSVEIPALAEQAGALYRQYPGPVAVLSYTDEATSAVETITAVTAILDGIADVQVALWINGDEVADFAHGIRASITPKQRDAMNANAVFHGRAVPAASREARAATLTGDSGPVESLLDAAQDRATRAAADPHTHQKEGAWLAETVRHSAATQIRLTDDEVARIVVDVAHGPWRDLILTNLDRADAHAHVALWSDVVRRTPSSHVTAPAAILALAAWLTGDGALAWMALDLAGDVDHSLVKIVATCLEVPIAPSEWSRLREAATAAVS